MIKNGIKENDAIAILIDRDEYMPILSFAVSKIAATYIPIDPSYPEDRINFMLKDCEAKLVLTLTKYEGVPCITYG